MRSTLLQENFRRGSANPLNYSTPGSAKELFFDSSYETLRRACGGGFINRNEYRCVRIYYICGFASDSLTLDSLSTSAFLARNCSLFDWRYAASHQEWNHLIIFIVLHCIIPKCYNWKDGQLHLQFPLRSSRVLLYFNLGALRWKTSKSCSTLISHDVSYMQGAAECRIIGAF